MRRVLSIFALVLAIALQGSATENLSPFSYASTVLALDTFCTNSAVTFEELDRASSNLFQRKGDGAVSENSSILVSICASNSGTGFCGLIILDGCFTNPSPPFPTRKENTAKFTVESWIDIFKPENAFYMVELFSSDSPLKETDITPCFFILLNDKCKTYSELSPALVEKDQSHCESSTVLDCNAPDSMPLLASLALFSDSVVSSVMGSPEQGKCSSPYGVGHSFKPSAYSLLKWDNKGRAYVNCLAAQMVAAEFTRSSNTSSVLGTTRNRATRLQITDSPTLPGSPEGVV